MKRAARKSGRLLLGWAALLGCLSAAAAQGFTPTAADTVDDVIAYPVPWAPNRASAATGTLQGGITFTNLPVSGTVKIYSLSGRLVRTLDISAGTLLLRWDGRNSEGAAVSSGIYVWHVLSGTNGKSGKLVVIR